MSPQDRGIALIIVVWAVILIGGFVTGIIVMGGGDAAITANRIDMARGQALAEAGVARAIATLADPVAREKLPFGRPFSVELEDAARISVVVRDSCGLIDLNWAPEPLLQAYAMTRGMKPDAASRYSRAVAARRLAAPTSGKDDWRSGPWQNLDQMADLPAMTPETLRPLHQGLTVNCHEAGADPRVAPDDVRQALGVANVTGSPSHGLAYEIIAQASLASGAKATIHAAIWLSRQPGPPYYYVTEWRAL